MKDDLGDRMKGNYEDRYKFYLTRRIPVIMRLDGKAFHSLTKGLEKPFDGIFLSSMKATLDFLCENIQGVKFGYVQSDEISLLITDFDTVTTDAWFDYNIQKMCSVTSGMASVHFTKSFLYKTGIFDCRVFNIPKEEVCNYFIWRQKDWIRNSIQMLAQSYFSHKELHKKNQTDMHEMLHSKGVNWTDLRDDLKNGSMCFKNEGMWFIKDAPIFTQNRELIENLLIPKEE